MGYLDKNINMALLLIIVITVVVLLAITIFFQTGLQTRTVDYETTSEELQACTTTLDTCQLQLEEKEGLVNSTSEDIRRYDTLYQQRTAELEAAQQQAQQLDNQLTAARQARDQAQEQVVEREETITELEAEAADLRRDVRYWRDRFEACRDDPNDC